MWFRGCSQKIGWVRTFWFSCRFIGDRLFFNTVICVWPNSWAVWSHTGGLLDINDRENFTYSQTIREVCLNYEFACQRVSHNEFRLVFIPFDEINVFFWIHGVFFNSNVRKCKKYDYIWYFTPEAGVKSVECLQKAANWFQYISLYFEGC